LYFGTLWPYNFNAVTKTEKSLIAAGLVASALLLLAIAAVNIPGARKNSEPAPAPEQKVAQKEVLLPNQTAPAQQVAIAPIPPGATSIPDQDLILLSEMVGLPAARDTAPDKTQWRKAIAIADKLLQGPCDCGQRNWLTHFVETGNYALSDAKDQFHASAEVVASLARNDKQEMALLHRPN
jgi:hypothetical protein